MPRNEELLRPVTVAKLNKATLGIVPQEGLPYWIVPVETIFCVNAATSRRWCRLAYPRHLKGCRNAYGKCDFREGAETIAGVDLSKPKWIVYGEFDIDAHAVQWKKDHPSDSDVQCRNSFYWQPKSLTGLGERVAQFLEMVNPQRFGHLIYLGESDGINLWRTANQVGVRLERIRGIKICRHMALFCFDKTKGKSNATS